MFAVAVQQAAGPEPRGLRTDRGHREDDRVDQVDAVGYTARTGGRVARKAAMARPTGVGRAISTYTIPIEGRDEWLAAARRLA
jgi:hypothetical protein